MSLVDIPVIALALATSYYLKQRDNAQRYPALKVEAIFLYPIKSLPPLLRPSVQLTSRSFAHDRSFVLISPSADGGHKPHQVKAHPQNSLIIPSIDAEGRTLTLTAPSGKTYSVPLVPSTDNLTPIRVTLQLSPVDAFDLGEEASAFFTEACGEETRLAYVGPSHARKVLGNMSQGEDNGIAFQDCASYMVATTTSLDRLSTLLGRPMSITPLRPSILLAPADASVDLKPWVEDYWSELKIGSTIIRLTANCVRCSSLNIDYETGKPLDPSVAKLPLAALSTERRVDIGDPYSPVFGRYGFSNDVGATISVGDLVSVTKLNKQRTVYDWPPG